MKKKILISTGGSGGHVVPATILYEHLKDQFDVLMTSDKRGVRFLKVDDYNLSIFNVNPISKNFFLIPFQFFLILSLIIKSIYFFKKNKIDILISTGGYMSLPLCLSSKLLNIKLFLFEPNIVLGRSNKFFINYCQKIFCYSDNIKNLPKKFKNKIITIPPLLRKKFYDLSKIEKINEEVNLLIIGGSQGARIFDTLVKNSIIKLSKKYKFKVYQQSLVSNFPNLKKVYQDNNIECELFDYSEDVSSFMQKSNICITRAGASTLAELVFLNLPHVAIPLPTAKDNHQLENANFYNEIGCNWILNQNIIDEASIVNIITNIIENKKEYQEKQNNMKNFSYQNSWNNINQKIKSIINEN
ncbi:MAG: UDP-N-acetylglucosamine--N-acetylmuramyl-(pentapeptide) pyrophosphoryl-undecaprenol N-acetylglucosamine transferase [Candidatus Pelagibacter sp.]|nr:UDP-N-acetylglucosamine--N-acetylmuramyl-(pentapeptide) pyrophosphoryl-undecaprenol N-acetylglucosamine transferase [Candidatus Pelagibacter sp.]